MAKLYGTADAALVSAAFREGISNIPLDLSGVYKQREQNIKDFATGVSNIMKAYYKDHTDAIDGVTRSAQNVEDILSKEGGIFNDAWILENENAAKGLKERLKTLDPGPEGDDERAAINRELLKYQNNMATSQTILQNLLANSANGSLLTDLEDNGELELWQTILSDIENNTNNANAKYKNGDWVFSIDGKEMSLSDINKRMTGNDPAYAAEWQKNFMNTLATKAATTQGNLTANEIALWKNDATKSITNWDQVRILESQNFGISPYTFKELLYGQANNPVTGEVETDALEVLYDVLDGIGGIDMDGKNGITSEDAVLYRNPDNAMKLVEELKKDRKKYTELMVGYMGENVLKDYWEQGEELRSKSTTITTPSPSGINFGKKKINISGDKSTWTNPGVLEGWGTSMNAKATIDLGSDGKYVWEDDGYVKIMPNGAKTKMNSKKQMILDLSGEDKMTTQFQSLDAYKNINDWFKEDTSNFSSINQDQLNTLVKRWGANKSNLKALGYEDNQNAQAILDYLEGLGAIDKFKKDGGEIKVDGETILVKGKDDAEWWSREGDSYGFLGIGASSFDMGDIKELLEKLGISYPGGESVG